jgi:hypothetical protein
MSNPSYQQGPGVPYQPYGTPQPSLVSQSPRGSRAGAVAAAVFVLLAGVAGGIVMLLLANNRQNAAVADLARAPIGCATTLDFAATGTFVVSVETKGAIDKLRGDCPNADRSYDYTGAVPDVDVLVVDDGGTEVEVQRDRSYQYDLNGYRGESIGTIVITAPGDYVLTASSAVGDVVVTVGKNLDDAAGSLRVGGFIAIGAGVIVGLAMLAFGLRRRPSQPGPGAPVMPVAAPPQPAYDVYIPSAQAPSMPPQYSPPPPPAPTAPPSPFAPPTEVMPTQPPAGGQWPAPPSA